MDDNVLPTRQDCAVVYQFGQDTLLHDEANERIHILNTTAHFVYNHCDGLTTVDLLVEKMRDKYPGVEHDKLRDDITSAVNQLRAQGLVV